MHGVSLIKNQIEALLEDFYRVTGIRIAFVSHDQRTWIEIPREKALFCSLLRNNASFEEACSICDKKAFETSTVSGDIYVYKCHAGLMEAISPIIYEKKLLGYLMLGQILDSEPCEAVWEKLNSGFLRYTSDVVKIKEAFYELKYMDLETIYSAVRIMDISAKFIHSNQLVKLKEPQLLERIKGYVEQNLSNHITVTDLSNHLKLSSSHLSHIIKANFHMSFTKYLEARRLERAKELLEQNTLKISEIAFMVGYPEQNYFTRVFKNAVGLSPTDYKTQRTK